MADAPVNVYLSDPTEQVNGWPELKERWIQLNNDAHGNPEFNPLTIKAFYVFGVQLAIFRCVSYLLEAGKLPSTTYLPAYGIFASGIELLGRCLKGNEETRGSSADLIAGLQWLSNPDFHQYTTVPVDHQLVSTANGSYSIRQLAALRNYTIHAQAAVINATPQIDFLILQEMPPIISSTIESYWAQLQRDPAPCNALARANIAPVRNRPIFDTLWDFSRARTGRYLAIGEIYGSLDWEYKHPELGI
jgi:hypothetical protein